MQCLHSESQKLTSIAQMSEQRTGKLVREILMTLVICFLCLSENAEINDCVIKLHFSFHLSLQEIIIQVKIIVFIESS